jgi:sn-glycerol 3-phosphate transport system substrate-binding protein
MKTPNKSRFLLAGLTASALVFASCGGGGSSSIIDSGSTEAPATGDSSAPTAAPTTVATPLASLPPCDTTALDSVTETVDITFWHGMNGDLEDALTSLTAEYNASQTKVNVSLENQGGYEQTLDKYLQSSQDSRPEMVQAPEYAVQVMGDTDSNVPVGACIESAAYDTSDFLPKALNQYFTEGVQWSMPFNVSDPVLYYNKKVFEAAGLDPNKPPTNMAEVRTMSQAIVDSGAAGFGLALDTGADSGGGWFLEQWFAKLNIDSQVGIDLLTDLQALVNDGLAYNVGDNASGQDALLKLADPDKAAAMTIATSAALGTVLTTVEGGLIPGITTDDIGVGPMPAPGDADAPGAIVGGASLWIVNHDDPAKAAAVWDFISFLITAESQSTWAATTGYVPVRSSALEVGAIAEKYKTDPRFKVAYDQLLQAADSPASLGAILGPQREIRTLSARAIATVLQGGDVTAALADAASQANALLSAYITANQ